MRRIAIHTARAAGRRAFALLAGTSPAGELAAKPVFTDAEIKIILSHGPWPGPAQPDPTNKVSGRADAIEFGTRLFFDQRLSAKGTLACASCHVPERNWTDNLTRGVGLSEVDPQHADADESVREPLVRMGRASDSLWSQSLRPILDERELAATPRHVAQLVRDDGNCPALPKGVRNPAVGRPTTRRCSSTSAGPGCLPGDTRQRTHALRPVSRRARRGGTASSWNLSEPAQRGLKIFRRKRRLHHLPFRTNFTSGEFFNTGLSRYAPRGQADPGRQAGIRKLMESRFNLLGPYNDDKTGTSAARTREASLERAVRASSRCRPAQPDTHRPLRPRRQRRDSRRGGAPLRRYRSRRPAREGRQTREAAEPQSAEQTDLVVFLESLSTFSNPWRPDDGGSALKCRFAAPARPLINAPAPNSPVSVRCSGVDAPLQMSAETTVKTI